jgi:PLP dependent protein
MSVATNVAEIRERMASAARRAGRSPDDIMLMAVSKNFPAELLREAYGVGIRVFGESRVQEFSGKALMLADLKDVDWHMIGHLQTNKAAKAAELFSAVDSVDSLRLAEKLNEAAGRLGKRLSLLIEINVGGETAKSGMGPESSELGDLLRAASRLEHLRFRGLMAVPPFSDEGEGARPYFRQLRELHDRVNRQKLPDASLDVLSMGMSHDFEVAIEEGSTCVRIGTAIFGERTAD